LKPHSIIEVSLTPGGTLDYRVVTTNLDTKAYGIALAAIVKCVAIMFQEESGHDPAQVREQITRYMLDELTHEHLNLTVNRMQ
jgi:hypothetical protein